MKGRALAIARFQPFHIGHQRQIQILKEDGYEKIIVVIGSAEKSHEIDNPFTCDERIEMVNSVLKDEGFKKYFIVPIKDVDDDDLWVSLVVNLAPKFDVVYSCNHLVIELFKKVGYKIVEIKSAPMIFHDEISGKSVEVTGTAIREMIVHDNPMWKKLVPKTVYEKILEFDGVERIKKLFATSHP